jgi:hypothetical protein
MYKVDQLGIGIEKPNVGIDIPASIVSVRYRKKMFDGVDLVYLRLGSGIGNSLHSGSGLTECWKDRHSGICKGLSKRHFHKIICLLIFRLSTPYEPMVHHQTKFKI